MAVGVSTTWAQDGRITDLANLSNTKCYYLKVERGYLKGDLTETSRSYNPTASDRFALIKNVTGTYCIYSVGQQKFLKNETGNPLSSGSNYALIPGDNCTFNIQSSTASNLIFPSSPDHKGGSAGTDVFVISSTAANHNWFQLGNPPKPCITNWCGFDEGNRWEIYAVSNDDSDFDFEALYEGLYSNLHKVTDASGSKIENGKNYFMLLPNRSDNTTNHNYVLQGTPVDTKSIILEHKNEYVIAESEIDNTYFWNINSTSDGLQPMGYVVKNVGQDKYISFNEYTNAANAAKLSSGIARAEKFDLQSTTVGGKTYWRLHTTGGNNIFSNNGGAGNGMGLWNSGSDTGGHIQFRPVARVNIAFEDPNGTPMPAIRWGVNGGEATNAPGTYYFVRDITSINLCEFPYDIENVSYKLDGETKNAAEIIEAINAATDEINLNSATL